MSINGDVAFYFASNANIFVMQSVADPIPIVRRRKHVSNENARILADLKLAVQTLCAVFRSIERSVIVPRGMKASPP